MRRVEDLGHAVQVLIGNNFKGNEFSALEAQVTERVGRHQHVLDLARTRVLADHYVFLIGVVPPQPLLLAGLVGVQPL